LHCEDEGYFSLYRVARHEYAKARSFTSVQSEIEAAIRQKRFIDAKEKVLDNLRTAACVRTFCNGDSEL